MRLPAIDDVVDTASVFAFCGDAPPELLEFAHAIRSISMCKRRVYGEDRHRFFIHHKLLTALHGFFYGAGISREFADGYPTRMRCVHLIYTHALSIACGKRVSNNCQTLWGLEVKSELSA